MKVNTRNTQEKLAPSELVLDANSGVYHLGLKPNQIAHDIIVVGDQNRVKRISKHFDLIEHEVAHREFFTHTGTIGNKRLTVLSTGIGVDNIDIVLNELDALVNIDLETRKIKKQTTSLRIVRIGTCGALNASIDVGSYVHSKYAIGLDGLMHYYLPEFEADETDLISAYSQYVQWPLAGIKPYAVRSSSFMDKAFAKFTTPGITITANGFYGPQGRQLRLANATGEMNERMSTFTHNGLPIANYEMESSALLGLGAMMGHECTTVCAVIANRLANAFLSDYQPAIDKLIGHVLAAFQAD